MKEFIRNHWIVCIIFIVALFLRTINLNEFPVGLHGDEASIGYNAYSLLNTLRDQDGNFLPIAIDQFGDFRPAGYHYLAIPFVAVLGLSEFAVRLPAALFASFSVIAIYFFVLLLFEKRFTAAVTSLLLAILPWDINISRASSEAVIATFFVLVGVLLFIKFAKHKRLTVPFLAGSVIFLLVSYFFYHAHRYFVPAFFLLLAVISYFVYKPATKKRIAMVAVFLVLIAAVVLFLTVGKGSGRVSNVGLMSIPGGTAQLKQAMDEEGTLNPLINRSYNNKLFYFGRFFLTFYTQHLSGDFLFVNNGYPVRYRMLHTGNLYIIMAPFLLLGFVKLLSDGFYGKKLLYLIPIGWLLIAPIPAGLTWEDLPNVIRASLLIPPLVVISAFGFVQTLELIKNRHVKIGILVICTLILAHNFLYFYHNYFWRSKIHEPWYRSTAVKELLFQVSLLSKDGQKIVMTTEKNNNLLFYLFYNKYDPKKFHEMGSPREHDGVKIENITYTYSPCPISGNGDEDALGDTHTIFVDRDDCALPRNATVLQTVRMPDGIPAYKIIQLK